MGNNVNKDIVNTNKKEDLTFLKEEIINEKNKDIVENFLSKMLNKKVKIKEYLIENTNKEKNTDKEKIVSLIIEINHITYKLDLNQIPGKNKKNIQIKKEET